MQHEVIVVGAGPAGSMTAMSLAQQGHDVLLLDRQAFPRDKTCGDAVPAGAVELMYEMGMKDKVETAVARGEFYPAYGMQLVSPQGHVLDAAFAKGRHMGLDSYVAPRLYLDAVLQQHALDSGAKFQTWTVKEPIVENGRVTGVRAQTNGSIKEIKAQMVVGADGVTSVITRALRPKEGMHQDGHRAVALRAYIEDLEEIPNTVEFFLYKEILPGYAWIFPIGEGRANIGLGLRLDHLRQHNLRLKTMLQHFLEMPAVKKRLKQGGKLHDIATWQLNFGSQKHMQHTYDGALLVGDAAGFINPLTGGGIHNALVSARLAAQTIHNALADNDTSRERLRVYETRCHEEMWDSMKRSYFMQRAFMKFPFLIDWLVRWGKENSQLAQTFLTKL
ncbi:MAG: NAD(P)/FAD-dependent oxidoreductase [Ardenticatenaceae bacterium]|nr:NAD(P)/FAD-dependent oxidoreductase [Ardenticatenaceae bacterium]